MTLSRRQFLPIAALGASTLWLPRLTRAATNPDQRFVFIIQRGAADGLDIVRPFGDPAYQDLRGAIAGEAGASIKLDTLFSLHPALTELAAMYHNKEALFIHAVASPYRDRSHFDGQNVLETGGSRPYALSDGWLNRLAGVLPARQDEAIAIAPTIPMALRGHAPVSSYETSSLPNANDDLMMRVGLLYDQDPQLHPLWAQALQTQALATGLSAKQNAAGLGQLAARFLTRDDGPRIAMIETEGWDTHTAQVPRLAACLRSLDATVAALRTAMGPAWRTTTVLVATEFGRTAAINGTNGTDHGTGTVAMLIGGSVNGGRVMTDWPGLSRANLYQDRDLKPTLALDDIIASVTADAFGLDGGRLRQTLFGQTAPSKPIQDLLRA